MTTVARGRRAAIAALVGVLLVLAAAGPVAARADDDFVRGSGAAIAGGIQVGPAASGLSLRWTLGESLAGYIGTVGQAESQTLDIGLWGLLLTAKQCDGSPGPLKQEQVPQPLRADSREPDAVAGKEKRSNSTPAGSPLQVAESVEQVRATNEPRGLATTTLGLASIPGVLDVRAAKTDTDSGVVKAATRVALSTVDVGDVDLLGGVIKLRGLQWTARQQTGKDETIEGRFSMGAAEIGGQAIPTNDPAAVIDAVNGITSQVGMTLGSPKVKKENGVVQVSPLLVRLQASPTQTAAVAPVLVNLQPARQAVIQAINSLTCRVQTIVTVADVSLGPMTGAGAFDFAVGGTSATTEGTRFENPFAAFPAGAGGGLSAAAAQVTPGAAAVAGTAFVPATPGAPATDGRPPRGKAGTTRNGTGVLAGARSIAGKTGGWAILVGFLALAGVVGVAGADWWRVRRDQS